MMTMMMMTGILVISDNSFSVLGRLRKAGLFIIVFQILILGLLLISLHTFINFETAFFTSMLVMFGSMYSYRTLVMNRVASDDRPHQDDLIDKIDDPYDLYSEDEETINVEDVDISSVIKEEKKKLKTKTIKNTVSAAPAMVSLFRIGPYAVMVLGFIALNNNHILMLWPYMLGLGAGVFGGLLAGKVLFVPNS